MVKMEPVRWLWKDYLPAGKFVILGGAPSCGKTTIAASLGAVVSSAGRWPDGWAFREAGDVLIWSGEDDAATTLAPRFAAAGADMKRVHFVRGRTDGEPFDPAHDMDLLETEAGKLAAPKLLIVDPIVSAVTGDNNKNNEVRRSLQSIVDLAARLDCTVIGIHHFSKGTQGRDPVERVTGSLAYGALARVVLVAAKEQAEGDESPRRVFVRAKSNLGPDGGGFAYTLEQVEVAQHIHGQRVVWHEALQGEARDLLATAEAEPERDTDMSATEQAAEFLRDMLKDGPIPSKQLKADAAEAGHSWTTIKAAKQQIGVKARREGFGKDGGWVWHLPSASAIEDKEDAIEAIEAGQKSSGPFGDSLSPLGEGPAAQLVEDEV
jgi:putative DNA primase/helicase